MQKQENTKPTIACYRSPATVSRSIVVAVCLVLTSIVLVGSCRLKSGLGVDAAASRQSAPSWPQDGLIVAAQIPAGMQAKAILSAPLSAPIPGGRIVTIDARERQVVSVLTGGFAAAAQPSLSFDAARVLFVGARDDGDIPSIWEIGIDGSNLRKVTDCPGGCAEAIYLSKIFTIDMPAPAEQIAFVARPTADTPPAIFTCGLDGSRVTQITFSPSGASDPMLLSDGRLLFAMPTPPEEPGAEISRSLDSAFFTVNTDGTDLFPFAGMHQSLAIRHSATQVGDDRVAYVEDIAEQGSSIVVVERARSLRSRRVLKRSRDTLRSLSASLEGAFLASSLGTTPEGSRRFRLVISDSNAATGFNVLFDDPNWHTLDSMWISQRKRPPGRASVVNRDDAPGQLYCLDANLTGLRRRQAADDPIRTVRFYADADTGSAARRTVFLGEAPVESDGSFFVELPTRRPIRLETIGDDGQTFDRMTSFFWVMPGERRGCIGCHEDRELTPPNRHVFALRRRPSRILPGSSPPATGDTPPKPIGAGP